MFNETTFSGLGDNCDTYRDQIYAAADRYGIDRGVALAQIRQESGCNPNAVGPMTRYGTAKGMAQFIDGTWAQYGSGSQFNPDSALDAWGRYMRSLLDKYNGNYSNALAAYNAGPGNVDKYGGVPPFQQTTDYVARILRGLGLGGGSVTQGGSSGDVSSGDTTNYWADDSDAFTGQQSSFPSIQTWAPLALLGIAAYFILR